MKKIALATSSFIKFSLYIIYKQFIKENDTAIYMNDFRPLNNLDNFENKKIEILLKNSNKITGTMKAYDLNLNLHLEDAEEINKEAKIKLGSVLLRGSMIININEIK